MTYGGARLAHRLARAASTRCRSRRSRSGSTGRPRASCCSTRTGRSRRSSIPSLTTQYRLAWGDVRAGLAKIAVAPRVDATVQRARAHGNGQARGRRTRAVQLQRQADGRPAGRPVATSTTDDARRVQPCAPAPLQTRARTASAARRATGSRRACRRRCLSRETRSLAAALAARARRGPRPRSPSTTRAARREAVVPRATTTPGRSGRRRRSSFPVKVAVIDSGHRRHASRARRPRRRGAVVRRRLAVPSTTQGHGTFVAGEIAANPSNSEGIAGLAFNAQLMIAKVVRPDGTVSLQGEVAGDPLGGRQRRARDQPQPRRRARPARSGARHVLAARAGGGRVRVLEGRRGRRRGRERPAVAGDAVEASRTIPAALPHVIGVSAVRQNGSVPGLLEPRRGLQRPRRTRRRRSSRRSRGSSSTTRGPGASTVRTRTAGRTSSATRSAPRSPRRRCRAAAALLLGQDPALTPEQVSWLLERSADDANAGDRLRAVPRRARPSTPAGGRSTC